MFKRGTVWRVSFRQVLVRCVKDGIMDKQAGARCCQASFGTVGSGTDGIMNFMARCGELWLGTPWLGEFRCGSLRYVKDVIMSIPFGLGVASYGRLMRGELR